MESIQVLQQTIHKKKHGIHICIKIYVIELEHASVDTRFHKYLLKSVHACKIQAYYCSQKQKSPQSKKEYVEQKRTINFLRNLR